MHIILLLIIIIILIFGPQWWAKHVLEKYSIHREDFPGTGGELAQHLLKQLELSHVKVEVTELGDHYNPTR
jgi:Zn-dependent membrane protease YugP